jgi:hypothetical protein
MCKLIFNSRAKPAEARGIVAEPATKARRAVVADGADSPTRAAEGGEAARPKHH